ncbi:MAG TPA: AAA family ATPase [Ktedonobacteraceae bacterium]|nr:AAA family ATPase [Ktedonobacteraceae bacterium]
MNPTASKHHIRLQRLSILNFKAFDKLEIEFPSPRMASDPDVFVMGSKNGQGKTTLLEASMMLFLAGLTQHDDFSLRRYPDISLDVGNVIVRAGAEKTQIEGTFVLDEKTINLSIVLNRKDDISIKGDRSLLRNFLTQDTGLLTDMNLWTNFSRLLAGLSTEPFILPSFIYFHSYRKVQEGSPELGMMVEGERPRRFISRSRSNVSISTFKLEVLRSLMSRGGLFENLDSSEADEVLNKLNDLMKQYAGGYIDKLRPSADNTIEFRVTPNDGGPSFTFDGLSSGQKEIISTLFLIWRYTQNQPGIVMIDEPELHLNPEWHRSFIRYLHTLAPDNQYLIATHSEDVFSAVDKDRRLLLIADKEPA